MCGSFMGVVRGHEAPSNFVVNFLVNFVDPLPR